jgi:hypothetical protein
MVSNKFKGFAVAAALGVSLVSGSAMAVTTGATASVLIDTATELKIVWQGDLGSFNSVVFVAPENWDVLGFFTNVTTKTLFGSSTTTWESAVQVQHAVAPHGGEAELGRIYTAYLSASMGGSGSDSKMDVHPPIPGDSLPISVSPANFATPHWDHYSYTVTSNVDGTGTATLYALHPVPEPESYAMFLAGLGLIGFMAKRRSRG